MLQRTMQQHVWEHEKKSCIDELQSLNKIFTAPCLYLEFWRDRSTGLFIFVSDCLNGMLIHF